MSSIGAQVKPQWWWTRAAIVGAAIWIWVSLLGVLIGGVIVGGVVMHDNGSTPSEQIQPGRPSGAEGIDQKYWTDISLCNEGYKRSCDALHAQGVPGF